MVGSILKNGAAIIRPQMVGGDQFHIGKDLNGAFIFTINDQSMKMTPAQAEDLAVRLLKACGCQIERVEQHNAGQKLAG